MRPAEKPEIAIVWRPHGRHNSHAGQSLSSGRIIGCMDGGSSGVQRGVV